VALPKFSPSNIPGLDRIHIDGWTLAITFGLSLFTGLLFGLAPALHCARADLTGTLKEGEAQASAGLHLFRRNKARSLLVMAEFGLALMLLVGAGLLANSFLILIRQKPGYNPEGVLALQISLPRARYPQPDMQLAFFDQLLQALRGVPGVQSAGSANLMPMTPAVIRINFRIPGHPESTGPESMPSAGVRLVSPGYLQTMGTRIISGRDFSDQDRENAAPVVMVNESMVRRWFSGANPIGRQVDLNGPREVIAVVEDVKPQGLDSEPQPELYLPHRQSARMLMMGGPANAMNVVVRTGGDPLTLVSSVRVRVGALDPQIPIFNVSTLKQRVSDSVAQPRFYAVLLGIFAGLALVLAAVGIYGVFSYHVSQCRREIGIRMALGAQRANLFFLILRQGLLLACVGVATGLAGAWAVNSFLSGFLFGISPTDPATYAAAAALMVFLALLASYLPARRAMAVDPVLALRQE
jgi:putative ABC transport system permease protein